MLVSQNYRWRRNTVYELSKLVKGCGTRVAWNTIDNHNITFFCLQGDHECSNKIESRFTKFGSEANINNKTYPPPDFPCLGESRKVQLTGQDKARIESIEVVSFSQLSIDVSNTRIQFSVIMNQALLLQSYKLLSGII